jgi:hypothetical protein
MLKVLYITDLQGVRHIIFLDKITNITERVDDDRQNVCSIHYVGSGKSGQVIPVNIEQLQKELRTLYSEIDSIVDVVDIEAVAYA